MIDPKDLLPFWLSGSQLLNLAAASKAYFTRWENWINEALAQASIADCSLAALEEHAVFRGIDRLPGETVAVWRVRVQNAFEAARKAGSRKGFEEILTAHGVTGYSVEERVAGLDWDIVLVNLDPDTLSVDSDTLIRIFARWGRPTRRFSVGHSLTNTAFIGSGAAEFIENHGIAA